MALLRFDSWELPTSASCIVCDEDLKPAPAPPTKSPADTAEGSNIALRRASSIDGTTIEAFLSSSDAFKGYADFDGDVEDPFQPTASPAQLSTSGPTTPVPGHLGPVLTTLFRLVEEFAVPRQGHAAGHLSSSHLDGVSRQYPVLAADTVGASGWGGADHEAPGGTGNLLHFPTTSQPSYSVVSLTTRDTSDADADSCVNVKQNPSLGQGGCAGVTVASATSATSAAMPPSLLRPGPPNRPGPASSHEVLSLALDDSLPLQAMAEPSAEKLQQQQYGPARQRASRSMRRSSRHVTADQPVRPAKRCKA